MTDDSLACVLGFDTDDPSFSRGFEAGRVWQMLRDDDGPSDTLILHGVNAEMILRMAESEGRSVQSDEMGNGWITVQFGPREDNG